MTVNDYPVTLVSVRPCRLVGSTAETAVTGLAFTRRGGDNRCRILPYPVARGTVAAPT